MDSLTLISSALLLGLGGSLHCVAMCSGLQQAAQHGGIWDRRSRLPQELVFQAGRVSAYALLGLIVGLSADWMIDAAQWHPMLRSVWAALQAAMLMLGVWMLITARQPFSSRWQPRAAGAQPLRFHPPGSPRWSSRYLRGAAWGLMPCGLLWSALAMAVLAGRPGTSALMMAAFGLGTAGGLIPASALLRWLASRASIRRADALAMRIGGLILLVMAAVSLLAMLSGQPHPFCR